MQTLLSKFGGKLRLSLSYPVYVLMIFAGKGTQVWKKTGAIYDGDWRAGLRHGFGTYSIKKAEGIYMKEYAGGWKNDMRHVSTIDGMDSAQIG